MSFGLLHYALFSLICLLQQNIICTLEDVKKILAQNEKINLQIQKAAPEWPIEKINKIDLAILRLAVFEIDSQKTPSKVIIDEAIEIAKKYGSESSPAFVNGVLGAIVN